MIAPRTMPIFLPIFIFRNRLVMVTSSSLSDALANQRLSRSIGKESSTLHLKQPFRDASKDTAPVACFASAFPRRFHSRLLAHPRDRLLASLAIQKDSSASVHDRHHF